MTTGEKFWYILSVKPRQEDIAKKNLEGLGAETYLPLYKKKKKINKIKAEVIAPLFPGYLFCRFDFEKQYQMVRYTRGVKRVLGTRQSLWVMNEDRIDDIRNREEDGLVKMKAREEERFEPGASIVVDEGAFDGWEGIFYEDLPDEKRAVILLTNVNFTTKLTLPKEYLKST